MAARNAQGLTVTYATNSYTAELTGFEQGTIEVPVLDSSHLGSTGWRSKIFGKLKEPGTLSMDVWADPDVWDDLLSEIGTSDTVTITFPVVGAQSSGATIAGSGALVSAQMTGSTDELITGTVVVAWAGSQTVTPGT